MEEFLKILGIVFLCFVCMFSFIVAFMLIATPPAIIHTIIGVPIALTVLAGSIFGISKLLDWETE